MKKITCLLFIFCFVVKPAFSQKDTIPVADYSLLFERISKSLADFKPDTTTAPDDKITRKIMELRNLRGGFNINEVIMHQMESAKQNHDISEEEYTRMTDFYTNGDGKKWLDNAVIWIYRQHFSYRDLKTLVKFYKTPAGHKWASDFPAIMLQTVLAAQKVSALYSSPEK